MSSYLTDLPYAPALLELAYDNPDVVLLTHDLGRFHPFADAFPERYIDVGIQESNLVSVAAGLAHTGKVAFVLAMAPFVGTRGWEQIRVDCAYNRNNVKIIGIFAGLYGGHWGPTHHATEDIAILRAIPGLTVLSPADAPESGAALRAAAQTEGPVYVRMGYSGPIEGNDSEFVVGSAVTLREGNDLTFIAEGRAVRSCLMASEILRGSGVQARVVNIRSIKPIDVAAVLGCASETPLVITVEEHSPIGGLGGAVAEVIAEAGRGRLARFGTGDTFSAEVLPHRDLLALHGLDPESIASRAQSLLTTVPSDT